jgi:hypothetical protein
MQFPLYLTRFSMVMVLMVLAMCLVLIPTSLQVLPLELALIPSPWDLLLWSPRRRLHFDLSVSPVSTLVPIPASLQVSLLVLIPSH